MKFLFDQNISHRILRQLPEKFSGSTSVKQEGLINASDRQIFEYAKSKEFIIVTQDADFNELNAFLGFPPKIVWFRMGNLTTFEIVEILNNSFAELINFSKDEALGCFEIKRNR